MKYMHSEWRSRLNHRIDTLKRDSCHPPGTIPTEAFFAMEHAFPDRGINHAKNRRILHPPAPEPQGFTLIVGPFRPAAGTRRPRILCLTEDLPLSYNKIQPWGTAPITKNGRLTPQGG